MPVLEAKTDAVWRAQDTSPTAIEAALRALVTQARSQSESYVPARSLNLVCIVNRDYSGEVANRLRGVGRFAASRTVVCSVAPRRTTLDATATIAVPAETRVGVHAPMRETVVLELGTQHLRHLETIVDPLVVTDVPTVVWSPHEHPDALDALLGLAQVVLIDSVDEPEPADAVTRIRELMERSYVVDLAWLRTVPWRERVAATFDPQRLRGDLRLISNVVVRHHPDSAIAGLLFVGWLASRLGWELGRLSVDSAGSRTGRAHTRRQDVALRLQADRTMNVRGLAGVELETASGRWLRFDRGAGGLRARYRGPRQTDREWTIMGASRGESGILGEGIRQALLRDPTYRPALLHAAELPVMELLRHSDKEAAARRAAALMADPGIVHLCLAGGSTPQRAYELLGGLRSSWEGVHLWFGDERCVEPESPDANWAMATRALDAPGATWHRIEGERGPDAAAAAYAEALDGVTLDLVLLGLGEDGHTASLFPGNPAVDASDRVVGVRGAPKPPPERVSLGLDVLNAAGRIVLLVAGAGKREPLARVLAGPDPDVPASLLERSRLTVVADAEALGDAPGEG